MLQEDVAGVGRVRVEFWMLPSETYRGPREVRRASAAAHCPPERQSLAPPPPRPLCSRCAWAPGASWSIVRAPPTCSSSENTHSKSRDAAGSGLVRRRWIAIGYHGELALAAASGSCKRDARRTDEVGGRVPNGEGEAKRAGSARMRQSVESVGAGAAAPDRGGEIIRPALEFSSLQE